MHNKIISTPQDNSPEAIEINKLADKLINMDFSDVEEFKTLLNEWTYRNC